MKTMYHATAAENIDSILESGLEAQFTSAQTQNRDLQFDGMGVWLFERLEDAKEYGYLNHAEIAVFACDVDPEDLIPDREYDEGSWILEDMGVPAGSLEVVYQTEEG